MVRDFFEGKDFKKEFKALIPRYYPEKYKDYIKEETRLLKTKVKGSNKILEAGIGIGRLIPELDPVVKEFIGVDNSNLMLKESKEIAKKLKNVKIIRCDLEKLSKVFSKNYFDYSLCVWNTLGNVKNEVKILRELSRVTKKSVIVSVYKKGTLKDRINWYKTVGIKINKIDKKREIFYSESRLKSKSYSIKDLRQIGKKAGLKISNSKTLAKVLLIIEFKKDN